MSKFEIHPSKLTNEEIFAIFDVIDQHGDAQEAQEEIRRKLHLRPPHRTTVMAVFRVGVELFRRNPNVLTDQEVDQIVEKAGYGISPSRVVELHRLYQLWKIDRRKETEELTLKDIHPLVFEQKIGKHSKSVLALLDTYASELKVTYEPEDFIPVPKKERLNDKELEFFLYAKELVPSLDSLMQNQIDSENIHIVTKLEMEPSFAALEGHYEGTKLWEDIKNYKQIRDTYIAAGLKLHKIITTGVSRLPLQVPEETKVVLEGLRELVKMELAPVRVKLNLEGIETDRGSVLGKIPDRSGQALQRFVGFVNKYENKLGDEARNDILKGHDEGGKVILELVDRLKRNYETMKRLYKAVVTGAAEEKLKGMLPPGTKCKFCPSA